MRFSTTTEVGAPPDVVFAVLSDVERWPDWTPTVTRVERLGDADRPIALGDRLRIVQPKVPPADWTITALESPRGFRLVSRSPGATVEADHRVEPMGPGERSRVTLSVTFPVCWGASSGGRCAGSTNGISPRKRLDSRDEARSLPVGGSELLPSRDTRSSRTVRIVSGGQTGVDRGALDAALAKDAECGGWCPSDRLAEDGPIPDRYPLRPAPRPGYRERTLRNVLDSDGTLLIYFGKPSGCTEETLKRCLQLDRPYLLVDAREVPPARAAELVLEFLREYRISILNVAGPRASQWEDGYGFSRTTVEMVLDGLAAEGAL